MLPSAERVRQAAQARRTDAGRAFRRTAQRMPTFVVYCRCRSAFRIGAGESVRRGVGGQALPCPDSLARAQLRSASQDPLRKPMRSVNRRCVDLEHVPICFQPAPLGPNQRR